MLRGQREREVRHHRVEKRDARFERMRHRRTIGLHEQVVDEVDAEVDVLEARKRVGAGRLGIARPVDVDRIERAAHAAKLRAEVGREDLLPPVVTLERRQMRGAHEPLRLVVEARFRGGGRQALDERTREACERRHPVGEEVGGVRVVAAEELVSALARERDLHVLGRELRHEVRRQCRRVGERLVEGLGERRQQLDRIGANEQLVMVRRVPLGDAPRVRPLVEAALFEADRERVHRFGRLLRREGGEHSRVDASGEEDTDRDVGEEVRAHRVAQAGAELLDELRLVVAAQRLGLHGAGPRITVEREPSMLLPDEHVPRRQLPDAAEDRIRRGDRVEREERLERVEVDLAARQRAHLGGELEGAGRLAVVERLDAVPVACEHEPPPLGVPERDREHPAQPPGELGPVLLVEMQVHLGVAVRAEGMTPALELAAELGVVVDLAVLDDGARAVLVRDRLIAAGEVDDREPPSREADGTVEVLAAAVGTAVDEHAAHRGEAPGVGRAASRRDSTDSAHRPNSMGGVGTRPQLAAPLLRMLPRQACAARRARRDPTASR